MCAVDQRLALRFDRCGRGSTRYAYEEHKQAIRGARRHVAANWSLRLLIR